ncbi:MAG: hypothetical protein WCI78_10845 [Mycobacterium sp.]|jgi:hypothetical protein
MWNIELNVGGYRFTGEMSDPLRRRFRLRFSPRVSRWRVAA